MPNFFIGKTKVSLNIWPKVYTKPSPERVNCMRVCEGRHFAALLLCAAIISASNFRVLCGGGVFGVTARGDGQTVECKCIQRRTTARPFDTQTGDVQNVPSPTNPVCVTNGPLCVSNMQHNGLVDAWYNVYVCRASRLPRKESHRNVAVTRHKH